MRWILLSLAFAIGMLVPLQPGVNAELKNHTGNAFFASFISFLGGVLIVAALTVASRPNADVFAGLARAPWWAWTGGALGATFVTASIVLAPKLGAALLVAGVVCGQMVSSLAIDHFGLVGYKPVSIGPGRVLGVLLVLAGVVLLQFSTPPKDPGPSQNTHNAQAPKPGPHSPAPPDPS